MIIYMEVTLKLYVQNDKLEQFKAQGEAKETIKGVKYILFKD